MTTSARCGGSRRASARSTRSRSASRRAPSPIVGSWMGTSSTSMGRRRRRRISSRQAFTSRRWSHASNRSGSRNPGRSRQARTRAFWTASRASSRSLRMRRAAASIRADAAGEFGKGVVIATARPLDQCLRFPRPLILARPSGRVCKVWRRRLPNRFAKPRVSRQAEPDHPARACSRLAAPRFRARLDVRSTAVENRDR